MALFSLALFMDEVSIAGKNIPGINRTFAYPAEKVEPPALVVVWPDLVVYDQTYKSADETDPTLPQAMTDFTIPVFIVIGKGGISRARRNQVAGWIQGQVKYHIESYDYTGRPIVTVTEGVTDIVELGTVGYLATKYTLEVTATT